MDHLIYTKEDTHECLEDRYWYVFLASSVVGFLIPLTIVLTWKACMRCRKRSRVVKVDESSLDPGDEIKKDPDGVTTEDGVSFWKLGQRYAICRCNYCNINWMIYEDRIQMPTDNWWGEILNSVWRGSRKLGEGGRVVFKSKTAVAHSIGSYRWDKKRFFIENIKIIFTFFFRYRWVFGFDLNKYLWM